MRTVPVLELRQVSKSFGESPVLVNVSFTVEPGEVVALTGSNGSGKSTLLRCVVGWDEPDSGVVLFRGAPYQDSLPAVRGAVALGLGAGDEFTDLTVREHLEFMARAHGADHPDGIVDEVLEELGLAEQRDRFPFTLSQGQRRRMGLAACFVRPRRLLILDEPEQNLDLQGREWLAHRISDERRAGVAVLMACHDADLVAEVADSEVSLSVELMDVEEDTGPAGEIADAGDAQGPGDVEGPGDPGGPSGRAGQR